MHHTPPVSRNRFFHAIRWIVNICWYLNFVLAAIGLFFLATSMFGGTKFNFSTIVRLNAPLSVIAVPGGEMETKDVQLKMLLPVNNLYRVYSFVFFFLFEFLVIAAIYNLRRVFRSLNRQSPFTGETIRRLRYTALFIGLLAPYNFLLSVLQAEVANAYIPAAQRNFHMNWNFGLPYIAVAAIIYIMVDIFRYGMQLQQENEAFV